MRSALREEVGAIREAAYAAIGGFHAACRTAAKAHAERTAQLLGADAAVQKLGPGGVAGLVADCEGLKGQLDRAQAELAAAGVAQRRLTADAELKTRELQVRTKAVQTHAVVSDARVGDYLTIGCTPQFRLHVQIKDGVTAHKQSTRRQRRTTCLFVHAGKVLGYRYTVDTLYACPLADDGSFPKGPHCRAG